MRCRTVLIAVLLLVTGCSSSASDEHSSMAAPSTSSTQPSAPSATHSTKQPAPSSTPGLPRPAHVVVVVLENHSFDEIVQGAQAPFIQSLVAAGAVLTQFHAITHPSEPNYLALFSGSTQGVTDDHCPLSFSGANLGRSLLDAGRTFVGYAEDLPSAGYTGCSSGDYARKHAPWTDFTNLPASVNQPMTAFPPDFTQLPTVSFVIPNLVHDMHNGPLPQADTWLDEQLGGYLAWARTHDSLLVLTADEDDGSSANRIATIVVGAHVAPGRYPQPLTHYSLLRTIEDMYGLPRLGGSATAARIDGIWR